MGQPSHRAAVEQLRHQAMTLACELEAAAARLLDSGAAPEEDLMDRLAGLLQTWDDVAHELTEGPEEPTCDSLRSAGLFELEARVRQREFHDAAEYVARHILRLRPVRESEWTSRFELADEPVASSGEQGFEPEEPGDADVRPMVEAQRSFVGSSWVQFWRDLGTSILGVLLLGAVIGLLVALKDVRWDALAPWLDLSLLNLLDAIPPGTEPAAR